MPPDMPENLKAEFGAIDAEVEKLPKGANGMPDLTKIPEALATRMMKLKTEYEAKTGKEFKI